MGVTAVIGIAALTATYTAVDSHQQQIKTQKTLDKQSDAQAKLESDAKNSKLQGDAATQQIATNQADKARKRIIASSGTDTNPNIATSPLGLNTPAPTVGKTLLGQ